MAADADADEPTRRLPFIPDEWAGDAAVVEAVAKAVFCAAQPAIAAFWDVEDDDHRPYYFELARAAIQQLIDTARRVAMEEEKPREADDQPQAVS